jgi:hypothetical protein
MMDFDERDLFRMAEEVGFSSVGLGLEIRCEPGSWFHEVELFTQHGRQPTRSHPGVDVDGVLERGTETLRTRNPAKIEARLRIKKHAFTYPVARK